MTAPLDGNVLAGPLLEIYGADLTGQTATCAACGAVAVIASARVFVGAGLVVRCRNCDSVLATVIERRDGIDIHVHALRGLPGGR